MNIEILISLDGENLPLNEELQGTITGIVNSYIKQKISGVRPKEKKIKVPKDPNAPKREARYHLTEAEKQSMFDRAVQLQNETVSEASRIIALEMNRAAGTIYTYLMRFHKQGKLQFAQLNRSQMMKEVMNRHNNLPQ